MKHRKRLHSWCDSGIPNTVFIDIVRRTVYYVIVESLVNGASKISPLLQDARQQPQDRMGALPGETSIDKNTKQPRRTSGILTAFKVKTPAILDTEHCKPMLPVL